EKERAAAVAPLPDERRGPFAYEGRVMQFRRDGAQARDRVGLAHGVGAPAGSKPAPVMGERVSVPDRQLDVFKPAIRACRWEQLRPGARSLAASRGRVDLPPPG